MSDPTRYEVEGCMEPSRKGDFVMWSDYAKLKAENERLRKAGDALIRICEVHQSNKEEYVIRWNAWQDAKELQS